MLLLPRSEGWPSWWLRVKRWLPVLLDYRIADMEKLIQSVRLGFGDAQYEEPAGFLKIGNPFYAGECDIKA
tara:strand:- start:137 stop:349 length:213 start_codon:yes stop_codon:yes gene_type:complete